MVCQVSCCKPMIVQMSERIELRNMLLKWKKAFESKGMKVNPGKTKVMVNGGGITKDGLCKSKGHQHGVCGQQ